MSHDRKGDALRGTPVAPTAFGTCTSFNGFGNGQGLRVAAPIEAGEARMRLLFSIARLEFLSYAVPSSPMLAHSGSRSASLTMPTQYQAM